MSIRFFSEHRRRDRRSGIHAGDGLTAEEKAAILAARCACGAPGPSLCVCDPVFDRLVSRVLGYEKRKR